MMMHHDAPNDHDVSLATTPGTLNLFFLFYFDFSFDFFYFDFFLSSVIMKFWKI